MYRLKGRPPGQVKATPLGTDASPPRSVVPGCSTPTKTRTVPSVRGWAPRRPPRLPHEQVGLHSGPRHAGEAGTPTGRSGASEPLPPRGKSPAWVLPKVQPPARSSFIPCIRRPGTSGAHGAGDCRRSRRRRSPVSPPRLARPELRRVPPRRACALGTPLAGAGPERAAEVTRRALKGPRAAKRHAQISGQEDGAVLFATRKRTARDPGPRFPSPAHHSPGMHSLTRGIQTVRDAGGLARVSIL